MRAAIAKSKGPALTIASNNEGNFEQCGFVELIAVNSVRRQSSIPETGKHQGIGRLALGEIEFRHELIVD
jgi:hypothetical protein